MNDSAEVDPPPENDESAVARAQRTWPFPAVMVATMLAPAAAIGGLVAAVIGSSSDRPLSSPSALVAAALLALFAIVYFRATNVAARWIGIGPGPVLPRFAVGPFLLVVLFAGVACLARFLTRDLRDLASLSGLAGIAAYPAAQLFCWSAMAASGERDVDLADESGRDTIRLRDALIGLALFSAVVAGLRLAWGDGAFDARFDPIPAFWLGLTLGLLGMATFALDAGVRLLTLGMTSRRRQTGKLVLFVTAGPAALIVLAIACPFPLFGGGVFLVVAPYIAMSWAYERLLARRGVAAINVQSEDIDEPPIAGAPSTSDSEDLAG